MTWSLCWFRTVGSEATRTEGDSPDFTKMSHINCIPIQRQIIVWYIKVGQKVVFIPWNPRKPLHCAFLANEHQRVGTCRDGREEAPCAASWRGSARGARRPVRAELDSSACTGQTQHEPTEHSPRGIQHRRFVLPLPHTSSPLLGGRHDTSPDTQQAVGAPAPASSHRARASSNLLPQPQASKAKAAAGGNPVPGHSSPTNCGVASPASVFWEQEVGVATDIIKCHKVQAA